MHAYLVSGTDKVNREKEIKRLLETYQIPPISRISLTTPHTIASIRELRTRLNVNGGKRAVVIEEAETLNIPSQNAFLKTLEEPPGDTIIILSSKNEESLLPTIRSRCLTLTTPSSQTSPTPELLIEQEKLFDKLSEAGIGEKISFVEGVKGRDEAIAFVEGQLLFLHSLLPYTPSIPNHPDLPKLTRALLQALSDLRQNINPKMTLFELLKNY